MVAANGDVVCGGFLIGWKSVLKTWGKSVELSVESLEWRGFTGVLVRKNCDYAQLFHG